MVREVAILNIKYTPHLFEYCSLSNLWWGRGNAGSSPPHSAPPPPRVANTQHSGDLSLSVPGSPTSEGWSPTGEEPASNGARRASWAGAALPRGRLLHATWGAAPWLARGARRRATPEGGLPEGFRGASLRRAGATLHAGQGAPADTLVAGEKVRVCLSVCLCQRGTSGGAEARGQGQRAEDRPAVEATAGAEGNQSYRLSGSGRKTGAVGLWSLAVRTQG